MKRWALLCAALLVSAGYASAQDHPTAEAFGGYSYLRVNPDNGYPGENFNGGSGSISVNPLPWLGVVADFGGYKWSGSANGGDFDFTVFSYLVGPKFALRRGRFTPFAQTLFGGARLSGSSCFEDDVSIRRHREGGTGGCENGNDSGFATALGGGVDWNFTDHIGVRLAQAEYVLSQLSFYNNSHQNNFRFSTGVVFRW
jgi:outer membrane immunogenic protein